MQRSISIKPLPQGPTACASVHGAGLQCLCLSRALILLADKQAAGAGERAPPVMVGSALVAMQSFMQPQPQLRPSTALAAMYACRTCP